MKIYVDPELADDKLFNGLAVMPAAMRVRTPSGTYPVLGHLKEGKQLRA